MPKNKIIIGLVGEFAAGKGAAAEYLTKKYRARVYKFSDPLNDILNRVGEKIIRDNQCAVANFLRKNFGEDILSKVLMKDAAGERNKIIVVDGFRKMGELNFFKKKENFVLINVKTDLKIRYERIIKRGEKVDERTKSLESFIKDHKLPADTDIVKVGKKADYTIDNSGTKKELYQQIDKIINHYTNKIKVVKQINEKK